MKIFITWSGSNSHSAAVALRDWLPYIFNDVDLFVSSEDIRKGQRWPQEIAKELNVSNFGIACLTPDNLAAPWLLFESGALSKVVTEARLFTLLFGGVKIGDVDGPLSHFQHTQFEKEDFYKLIGAINDCLEKGKRDEARLKTLFEKLWPDLESQIPKTFTATAATPPKRDPVEMMEKLLELTNEIARTMPKEKSPATKVIEEVARQFRAVTNVTSAWDVIPEDISKRLTDIGIASPKDLIETFPNDLVAKGIGLRDVDFIQHALARVLALSIGDDAYPILSASVYEMRPRPRLRKLKHPS